jgi:hypothetical protein
MEKYSGQIARIIWLGGGVVWGEGYWIYELL